MCCVVIHERQKLDAECVASESSSSTGQEFSKTLITQNQTLRVPNIESGANTCTTYVACDIEGSTGLSLGAEHIYCAELRLLLAASWTYLVSLSF